MNTEIVMDPNYNELEATFRVVDGVLTPYSREISWNEGARDLADYWVGVGFVACQRYFVTVTSLWGISKKEALDAGPKFCGGDNTVVSIINAAANMWKHQYEWEGESWRAQAEGREEKKDNRKERTLEALGNVLGENEWEYSMANVLYALCSEIRFSPLESKLAEWRDSLAPARDAIVTGEISSLSRPD